MLLYSGFFSIMYLLHVKMRIMNKTVSALFVVAVLFILGHDVALAGFGITPPYVRNTSLTRNSTYEQQILMVQGDPKKALKALITVDAPEIEDWLEIVEGKEILLPAGEQKVPMTVRVKVPSDAEFKSYEGAIRIKTVPADTGLNSGAVNISLGAQIDVNLTVIDKVIEDFRVRRIDVSDLNEGHKLGWLYFPGKIRFGILIENIGNVEIAPSNVVFRIYDQTGTVLLEETENIGKMKKVPAYETGTVMSELPTALPAGTYLARYAIYNKEDVKQEGEFTLSILPYGTLQTAGFGFRGLSLPHKVSIVLPVMAFMLLAVYIIYIRRQVRRRA